MFNFLNLKAELEAVKGQNDILLQWNEELKIEIKELKQLLYAKFGIIETTSAEIVEPKPILKESWNTARSKLEEKWKKKEEAAIAKGELSA